MTTINLQQNQRENHSSLSGKGASGGFIFSLGILVVTLLVLAGLKYYAPIAEGKNVMLDEEISNKNIESVGLKSLERVSDMQQRIKEIRSNLQIVDGKVTRKEMTQVLDHLAGELDKGTMVTNFKYDANNVTVSFDTNNFSDAAKQILNFKKSDYFTEVELSNISRGENTIACSMSMKIKK